MRNRIHQKFCFFCAKPFYTRSILSKYCCRKCSNAAFRRKNEPSQAELKKLFEQQNEIEDKEDTEKSQVAA